MRRHAHVFLATSDNDFRIPTGDRLHGQMNRFQSTAANLVDGQGRGFDRQASSETGLTGRILTRTSGQYLSENHFINLLGLNASTFQQAFDHSCAKLMPWDLRQTAAKGSNGTAGCPYDNYVFAHVG
jgi:hypothetical protein